MKSVFLLLLFAFSAVLMVVRAQPQLELELFASGLESPIGLVNAGDERLFVVEQRGQVQVLDETGTVAETPFIDLSDVVSQSGFETGLLGLAFHPDYNENGYFYVNYTRATDGSTVVSRFSADPDHADRADRQSEVIMFTVAQPYGNHNGGQLLFGPDGYLYIALGDGGDAGDPHGNGQDLSTMLGKMLRIDVNADNDSAYVVPPDNPFAEDDNAVDEIWAYGLRNPWRNSFDRYTGDFWIADVGQNEFEEVNFQPAGSSGGENYGWRGYEGNAPFNTQDCGEEENFVFPVFEYPHEGESCSGSVTGGYVYRGAKYNGMFGNYVFSDFCTGNVYVITPLDNGFEGSRVGNFGAREVTAFGEDRYGELYVVKQGAGEIHKLVETGDCNPVAFIASRDSVLEVEPDSSMTIQAIYNPSLTYQWYSNDEPVSGEVQSELAVTAEGSYSVHVTNPETGCTNVSLPVQVTSTSTSVALKQLNGVKAYPNPAVDVLRVEGLPVSGKSQISLFDSRGVSLYNTATGNIGSVLIPIREFPDGMYHLRVIYDEEVVIKKISVRGH